MKIRQLNLRLGSLERGKGVGAVIFAVCLWTVCVAQTFNYECKHVPPKLEEMHFNVRSLPSVTPRLLHPPLKFLVEYHESVTNTTANDTIQALVKETTDLLSKQLRVKQSTRTFILGQVCPYGSVTFENDTNTYCIGECRAPTCSLIPIPDEHLEKCHTCNVTENGTVFDCGPEDDSPSSPGAVDIHYILYVASIYLDICDEGVIAFAGPCYLELELDRPVVGFINICPQRLDLQPSVLQNVIQHEIYHALGFTPGLFAFFRDDEGNPLTPRNNVTGRPEEFNAELGVYQWSDRVVRPVTLDWDVRTGRVNRTVHMLVTPNMMREVQAHFNCSEIDGVEIENGGGGGTAFGHFERRVFPSESMNGILTASRAFSRMTLAYFEDTGWYKPNYDLADPLMWGRDLGCYFVNNSCKGWMDHQMARGEPILPYCNQVGQLSCNSERTYAGICTLIDHDTTLPIEYQYFPSLPGVNDTDVARYGGVDPTGDYCPLYETLLTETYLDNDLRRIYCEADVNECENSPCLNNGTCNDIITGYFCDCLDGFEGARCEYENSLCTSPDNCTGHEDCINDRCVCNQGRIRRDGICVTSRKYSLRFVVPYMNGEAAVYTPELNAENDEEGRRLKQAVIYEIFNMLSSSEDLLSSVVAVYVTSFYNGSLGANMAIDLAPESSADDFTIFNTIVDAIARTGPVFRSGNTSFVIATSSVVVEDINECNITELNECSLQAICTNTNGSYECNCMPGYDDSSTGIDGSGRVCVEIDECQDIEMNDCSLNATCNNTDGSYNCTCTPGYVDNSTHYDRPGRVCTEIDECNSDPCQNGATCTDEVNAYSCACVPGYEDTNCETDINECDGNPCQNGANCTDEINSYSCSCALGYEGNNCETEINECNSDPCQNGATCTDEVNAYSCACIPGYEGTNCETDINECGGNPCLNGATCTDEINWYSCACIPGYEGSNCETDINECQSSPCQNGATCSNNINAYSCTCVAGYEGTNCQADINECSSNPCQNDGTCTESINSYSCQCVAGFEGTNCETDINECTSSPCQNGATCMDNINSYSCSCIPGYEGINCETEINECSSDPCQNGATCTNNINSYSCSCIPGYEGTNCEIDIDECVSRPCQNNGVCRDFQNSYTCTCPAGFEGTNCEFSLLSCANNNTSICTAQEVCADTKLCECKPGLYRRGSLCEALDTYQASARFTTLSGTPLQYTASLADPNSQDFRDLAELLRGLLLSQLSNVVEITITAFRKGSVIGDFTLAIDQIVSGSSVQDIVRDGLSGGNSMLGVDINSISVTDINECLIDGANDCSPNATCFNSDGTYTCSCRTGYRDTSPSGAGPGRVCERDETPPSGDDGVSSTTVVIIVGTTLGVVVVFLFIIVTLITCYQFRIKGVRKYRDSHLDRIGHTNALAADSRYFDPSYRLDNLGYWNADRKRMDRHDVEMRKGDHIVPRRYEHHFYHNGVKHNHLQHPEERHYPPYQENGLPRPREISPGRRAGEFMTPYYASGVRS